MELQQSHSRWGVKLISDALLFHVISPLSAYKPFHAAFIPCLRKHVITVTLPRRKMRDLEKLNNLSNVPVLVREGPDLRPEFLLLIISFLLRAVCVIPEFLC